MDLVLINDPKRKVTDEGVLARTTWVALDRETIEDSSSGLYTLNAKLQRGVRLHARSDQAILRPAGESTAFFSVALSHRYIPLPSEREVREREVSHLIEKGHLPSDADRCM